MFDWDADSFVDIFLIVYCNATYKDIDCLVFGDVNFVKQIRLRIFLSSEEIR